MSLHNTAQAAILRNMPPSDFKDLIDAALHLQTDSLHFLQEINCLPVPHNNKSHEPKNECCITERQMTMARDLVNRYDGIGRHYGWVLAGDHACVDEALRAICEAGKQPSEWFKELVKELEYLRALLEISL